MEKSIEQTSAVNEAIARINESLQTINEYSDQIVSATDDQEKTTSEVAQNIHMIVKISEKNVQEVAKVTNSCADLNKLAKKQAEENQKYKF